MIEEERKEKRYAFHTSNLSWKWVSTQSVYSWLRHFHKLFVCLIVWLFVWHSSGEDLHFIFLLFIMKNFTWYIYCFRAHIPFFYLKITMLTQINYIALVSYLPTYNLLIGLNKNHYNNNKKKKNWHMFFFVTFLFDSFCAIPWKIFL